MSRILAIDYGQKRTGIAVTDTLQMIANGLTTVDTRELEKFIVDYMAQEDVSTIVVGNPTQTNGENSAHQAMLQSGIGKKVRQNKALVDKISATIILEDYLQSIR